jgi:hypothetical protein
MKLTDYTANAAQIVMSTNNFSGSTNGWQVYYENRSVVGSPQRFSFFAAKGSAGFSIDLQVDNAVTDNNWHHYAVRCDNSSGTADMFIDGVKQTVDVRTFGTASTANNLNDLTIGALASAPTTFELDGVLDEIGIWNKSLSDDEVTDLYNAGSGLPFNALTTISAHPTLTTSLDTYYKFDANANDSVASNNGTVTGATLTTGNGGQISEGYDFDGVNDYITAASDITGFKSVSVWFNPTTTITTGAGQYLMSGDDDTTAIKDLPHLRFGESAGAVSNELIAFNTSATGLYYWDTTAMGFSTIVAGNWNHLVLVWDSTGSSYRLYFNGVDKGLGAEYNSPAEITTWVTPRIGARLHYSNYWDGQIDETAFWTKALTAEEVTDLYNEGAGLPYD